MLRATIHGLSAHSVDRADRRAQSVDSGNPWIELNVAWIRQSCGSFTKGARSRCSWPVLCTRARRVVCACAYRPRNTCHHFAPVLLLLYESIPDVVLERFSVNHGRRSWRVSQLADRQNSLSPRSMPRV